MGLLSLLDLLSQSGPVSPDQLLLLFPYFHLVLVVLVSLELLVFLVNQLPPVSLAHLEFLEIPLVQSLQSDLVLPVFPVSLALLSLPSDRSVLVFLAHLEVLLPLYLQLAPSILAAPAVLPVLLHLLVQPVLASLAHLEVLSAQSPPLGLVILFALEGQSDLLDLLDPCQ